MKNHRIQRVLIAAFCSTVFSASASDIQMFGFFDQGLAYLHEDLNAGMGGPAGQSINAPQYVDKDGYVAEAQTKRSFTQGSGNVSTWGIKGSEQINADVRTIRACFSLTTSLKMQRWKRKSAKKACWKAASCLKSKHVSWKQWEILCTVILHR